jgi:tRNA A-37 threonylcarbamoyl transferase component Bud32
MAILEEAASRGISTAPLAFGATGRREDGGEVALMATELIRDSIRLGKLIDGSALPGLAEETERRAGLRAAGAEAGRVHDLGLDHADLNIGNILLRRREGCGGWQAFIIDMGLSKLGGSLDAGCRAANLVRLLRSAEKHLGKDPRRLRDAASFLQGYLSGAADPGRRRRRDLLAAIRRRLPAVALHRLGWSLLGRT